MERRWKKMQRRVADGRGIRQEHWLWGWFGSLFPHGKNDTDKPLPREVDHGHEEEPR
jgi:hypothetical protein